MEALKLEDQYYRAPKKAQRFKGHLVKKYYTYADLQTWDTKPGERWELFDGTPRMMASPTLTHQFISDELTRQMGNFLLNKPCRVISAPFDVRLFPKANDKDDTYVQPDLIVVCDKTKLFEHGCKGAPDLVVEVLSPSTSKTDMVYKFKKYRDAGVREYWIVDPEKQYVMVCSLKDGEYVTKTYDAQSKTLESGVLAGCVIDLAALFPAPVEEGEEASV
jgi:Uma2 family endonuclease